MDYTCRIALLLAALPRASAKVSASTDKLCYKVSWNLASSQPSAGVIRPITSIPSTHPSVRAPASGECASWCKEPWTTSTWNGAEPACRWEKCRGCSPCAGWTSSGPAGGRTICNKRRDPGDRIEAYTMWPAFPASLANQPLGKQCVNQSGAVVFYGYDYPFQWSANTGYYAMDTVTIYLIIDSLDRVYLVLTLDEPWTEPGGHFAMDVTSSGLPAENPPMVVKMDDGPEQHLARDRGALPLGLWDGEKGSFYWKWGKCCTDGMVRAARRSLAARTTLHPPPHRSPLHHPPPPRRCSGRCLSSSGR